MIHRRLPKRSVVAAPLPGRLFPQPIPSFGHPHSGAARAPGGSCRTDTRWCVVRQTLTTLGKKRDDARTEEVKNHHLLPAPEMFEQVQRVKEEEGRDMSELVRGSLPLVHGRKGVGSSGTLGTAPLPSD